MEVKTYSEILTMLCDNFDTLISPKKIARTNTNIIYLLFKAISKGFELINNVCVTLSNKFDPVSCSEDDLESVAKLVGTSKRVGSASGLSINVYNQSDDTVTLLSGTYTYEFDEDVIFNFDVLEDTEINSMETKQFIAMSEKRGKFEITEQSEIVVTSINSIPDGIKFSCGDNHPLLGTEDETNLEFRQRINTNTTRQDSLAELSVMLKNLPYIFDASLYFNNSLSSIQYDGYTIPPYHLAVFFSGEARNEIAEVIASKAIYPTAQFDDSIKLKYINNVFASGEYDVYITPFKTKEYTVEVSYKIDTSYANTQTVEETMGNVLLNRMNKNVHSDYVKENEVYDLLESLNLVGVDILNVDLKVNGSSVSYVEVPLSRLARLTSVAFTQV